MSSRTRLALASGTLVAFWVGLFGPMPQCRSERVGPPGQPGGVPAASGVDAAGPDRADVETLLAQSRDAFEGGQLQQALEPTRALTERFPNQHVYLWRLAQIHHGLEQTADEAAALELFMERAPLPAEACPQIGQAYRRLGQFDKALSAFERCFESDSRNPELAFFVGLGNEWLTRFDTAAEFYARAIAMATVHYDSATGLARLRLHTNRLAEALALASGVLAAKPDHVDALLVAGLAEQRSGHPREARGYLEKAVTLAPDYFDIQVALGILDMGDAHPAEARVRFETARRLDPSRADEVRTWLARTASAKEAS
ncbi:MAG: tetratricopeptide repeat protein [Vicinamibacterales bacterium]